MREFSVNTETTGPEAHERLLFRSRPVAQDVVVAGSIEATIRASFTAAEGHLAVVVYDERPDGTRTRVTEGWLKASHHRSHSDPLPVRPGQTYDLGVHVLPTHYRLTAGHRLVVRLSSDDYPEIDSVAPAGRVSVEVGARGSRLTVPVLDGELG